MLESRAIILPYPTALWLAVCTALILSNCALAQELPLTGAPPIKDEEPTATIAREAGPAEDRAIERRLRAIFTTLEELKDIQVDVQAGVVKLTGEVPSGKVHDQALRLARRIEGVVAIEDQITEVHDIERRLVPALEKLQDRLFRAISFLPLLIAILLTVLAFWLLARLTAAWERPYRWLTPNQFLSDLLRHVVQGAIFIGGILLVLELLDATALVGTLLGAVGLLGLAVGFALRDTVENYIASILLSLRQPFEPNDQVVIEGHEGFVVRLTSRATILLTLEGNHVRIPNATVFSSIILNYTRNPQRRFDFTVGVDTKADLVRAQTLSVATLKAMDGVLDDPPPTSWIENLGDFNVTLRIAGWVDQRQTDFARTRSEAIRLTKQAFETVAIDMPEPTYNLRLARTAPKQPAKTARPVAPSPSAAAELPIEPRLAIDVSRDTHLDRQIAQDRMRAGEPDLLDLKAPKE